MQVTSQVAEARELHAKAVEQMEEWDAKLQALPDDAAEEEIQFTRTAFDNAQRTAERRAENVERLAAIEAARKVVTPPQQDDDEGTAPEARTNGSAARHSVGSEPLTYRKGGDHSFFRDVIHAKIANDETAQKRLHRHGIEMRVEQRDVTTGDPGAAGFIPPIYLADRWIELRRPKRPFADVLPKIPLSPDGMRMDFPRVQSGATVASQATENTPASETDPDSETYSVNVRTLAGKVDLSRQSWERSRPGFDEVVMRDLIRAYDGVLDTQLISGAGTGGTHIGLRNVPGIISVSNTTATGAGFIARVYDAASQIASQAFTQSSVVLLHPRRAAAVAAALSSQFPLLQQGALNQAVGTQDNAFATTVAGHTFIADPNIATNLGAGTNEDEAYVLALEELMLAEGDVRVRVYEDKGHDTLTVGILLYAYSAAPLGRVPKAVARISGTGMVPPTFGT